MKICSAHAKDKQYTQRNLLKNKMEARKTSRGKEYNFSMHGTDFMLESHKVTKSLHALPFLVISFFFSSQTETN